jgi:general secretion pathway protein H
MRKAAKEKMRTSQAGLRSRDSQGGYTLLELMVVIAILALMTGITVTRLSGTGDRPRFGALVRDVEATLRLARSAALTKGQAVAFWMNIDSGQYGFDGGPKRIMALDGVSLTAFSAGEERLQANEARILFFPDGSATGGIIEIAAGRRSASIHIDWMTGNVDTGP